MKRKLFERKDFLSRDEMEIKKICSLYFLLLHPLYSTLFLQRYPNKKILK